MVFRLRLISASLGIGIDFADAIVVVVIVVVDEGLAVSFGMALGLLMANPIISGGSFSPGMLL